MCAWAQVFEITRHHQKLTLKKQRQEDLYDLLEIEECEEFEQMPLKNELFKINFIEKNQLRVLSPFYVLFFFGS